MKIQKSLRGTILQALATSILASMCAIAQAEPACSSGVCPRPAIPSTPPAAPVLKPVASVPVWAAPREASLRELLSLWATTAGWQEPVWNLKPDEDFTLGASFEHRGELPEALSELFEAFPPDLKLHVRTYAANRLIVVEQAP